VFPALPPIVATTPGPVLPALPPIVATAPGPVLPGPSILSPDLPITGLVVAGPGRTVHAQRNQRHEPNGHRRHNARPRH